MNLGIAVLEFGWLLLITSVALILLPSLPAHWPAGGELAWMALPSAFSCTLSYYYNDLYNPGVVKTFRDFCSRLPQALLVAAVLLALYFLVAAGLGRAPSPLSYAAIGALFAIAVSLPLRWTAYAVMANPPFSERILILGTGPLAFSIAKELRSSADVRHKIVGALNDGDGAPGDLQLSGRHALLLGSVDELRQAATEFHPHRIIVALTERRRRLPVQELLNQRLQGLVIEDGIEAYERIAGKLAVESLRPSSVIFSKDFHKSRWQIGVRRVLSAVVAAIGLILIAPFMALIALLIKLDSRGPVFFRQERIGMGGRHFWLFKFRTMVPTAESISEWERDNLGRITRVGHWLRKFRLDELPQLVNILRGEMNLIGPRPHPVTNYNLFTEKIPYYSLRSILRPGMTGWAQIRFGYANNLEEELEKMRFDLYYIKNMSIWLDLRILVDTVRCVLFAQDASTIVGQNLRATTTV
jgi:exopolysaccharide biosynthesis polyprenyl glycosylphosphotransferase